MVIETVGVHETPLATSLTNWVSYRSHFDTWGQLTLKTHCHCEQCCFGLMSLSDPQLLHFSLLFLLHCPTSLSTIFFFPHLLTVYLSVQFSSVAQSRLTLCDPMDCSTPGLPVHHQLLELTQTHAH